MKKIFDYKLFLENYKIFENEKPSGNDLDRKAAYVIAMAYKCLTTKSAFQIWFEYFVKLRVAEAPPKFKIKTMATDGKSIFYNPQFVNQIGVPKATFVIIHEIMHNAMKHFSRIEKRHPKLWNIAGDYAINIIIKDMISDMGLSKDIIDVPDKILLDEKYRGKNAEAIYSYLRNKMIEEKGIDPENPPKPKNLGKYEIKVGDKVRIKSTGKVGRVVKINPNKTYEVIDINIIDKIIADAKGKKLSGDDILDIYNKKYAKNINKNNVNNNIDEDDYEDEDTTYMSEKLNLINESYKRTDLSPILSGESGGDGGEPGSYEDDDIEYEDDDDSEGGSGGDEGDDSEGDEQGDGQSGKGQGQGQGKTKRQMQGGQGGGQGKKLISKTNKAVDDAIKQVAGDTGTIGDDVKDTGELGGEGKTLYDGDEKLQDKQNSADIVDTWREINVDVANKTKNNGKISGNLKRVIDSLTKPMVDWKTVLMKFAKDRLGINYKLKNFNRRLMYKGTYIQGIRPNIESGIKHAVIAFDTSGSIGDAELKIFASELDSIFTSTRIDNVDVIWCDADVKFTQRFDKRNRYSADKLLPAGGGGTDLRPPFEWVKKRLMPRIKPSIFIYFTDGYGTFPKVSDYNINLYLDKILWVITTNNSYSTDSVKPPFGEYINLDISDLYKKR